MTKLNKQAFSRITHNLKRIREQQKDKKITFGVIYTALYAMYVHENLEAYHPNGQAKFLEEPLRQHAKTLTKMTKDYLSKGKTLRQALKLVGEWLLAESKKLVPVDTGALRDSGIVKIIKQQ